MKPALAGPVWGVGAAMGAVEVVTDHSHPDSTIPARQRRAAHATMRLPEATTAATSRPIAPMLSVNARSSPRPVASSPV
jgi:hypothetical protein